MLKDGKYDFRVVDEKDLEMLARHRNSQDTWMTLTTPLPVYPHRQRTWLESLGKTDMYFIGRYDSIDVGVLRVNDIDWVNRNCAVGIDIFQKYRGRGHATPLFKLLCRYAIRHMNMHHLWLLVMKNNHRAIKVYKNVGFKEEGVLREHIYRDGAWVDYVLMGLIDRELNDG